MYMKTLTVWDFDDTFIRTPGPEAFKELFNQGIMSFDGINKDRFTFWDNPLSLDTDYFQLVVKKPAFDLWKKNNADPDCTQILITNRCTPMLAHMKNIFDILGISMYDMYSGSDNGGKINVLSTFLKEHDPFAVIQIIEDSIYNLSDYQNFLRKIDIPHDLYFVNTHSMGFIAPGENIPEIRDQKDIEMTLINI